jgi:GT2 family glycosyltransferase
MRQRQFQQPSSPQQAVVPSAPTDAEWASLRRPDPTAACIDIVMPVYAGRAETLRAIHRVLSAANRTAFELVVVNDATEDDALAAALAELSGRGLLTLLANEHNLGFVASCNRGASLHPSRDLVLLNADTEVFGNWLDRLKAVVDRADDIATVTPMSNAATILSYPHFLKDWHAPLEIDDAALDGLMAALDHPPVEIPTAVGFCMYVKRRCWSELSGFDETSFGRGYGEENDFCRRAVRKGWRNLAATNVFVRHHSGRSFGAEKDARVQAAVATVERLHPGYLRLVRDFIAADPLAGVRRQIDEARIRRASPANVLVFGKGRSAAAEATGLGTIRLTPRGRLFARGHFFRSDQVGTAPNLAHLDLRKPAQDVTALLHALGIVRIDPSGAGPLSRTGRKLAALGRQAGIAVGR